MPTIALLENHGKQKIIAMIPEILLDCLQRQLQESPVIPSLQHSMLILMAWRFFTFTINKALFILLLLMLNMNKINLPISDKDAIRAEVKQRISLLSEKEKNEVALSLCEKLCNLTIVQEAQNIIGYQALSDEISLTPFLEAVKKQGKNIIIIDSSGHISPLPSEGIILVP